MFEIDTATSRYFWVGLFCIILLTGFFRFAHLDWDNGYLFHPDERGIIFVAESISLPDTSQEFFSPRSSPLDPYSDVNQTERLYAYGHLHLYLTSFILRQVSGKVSFPVYYLRGLSGLFDLGTVLVVIWLGRTLFDQKTGLLAGFLMGASPIHIQNAHFATVDSMLAFFCVATPFFCVHFMQTQKSGYLILAGVCTGMALGAKITGLFLVVPLIACILLSDFVQGRKGIRLREVPLGPAAGAIFVAVFVASLTNPYYILDVQSLILNMQVQSSMISGAMDVPFTIQYRGTWPLIYPIFQQAIWGLGLPLTMLGYAGSVVILLKDRRKQILLIFGWLLMMFLVTGLPMVKFPRYTLVYTPILILFASRLLTYPVVGAQRARIQVTLMLFVVLVTGIHAFRFFQNYNRVHPWIDASHWISQNVPTNSVLLIESHDSPLPIDLVEENQSLQAVDHVHQVLFDMLQTPDTCEKMQVLASALSQADYLVISSSRNYAPILRLSKTYPYTSAYYTLLFKGEIGFDPVYGSIPGLARHSRFFYIDESFTVYDQPATIVFENRHKISPENLSAILCQNLD